jgi:hypothetical protein
LNDRLLCNLPRLDPIPLLNLSTPRVELEMKVLRMLVDVADHDFDKQGIGAAIFDSWLPVKDAAPAWCGVLGSRGRRAELS